MTARVQSRRPSLGLVGAMTVVLVAMVALGGCTNLSGLGGESRYACKAPVGVTCDSVSGTYANAIHNNLPSQRQKQSTQASTPSVPTPTPSRRPPLASAPALATTGAEIQAQGTSPLRSQARILRLWTKPWEDTDGDLYDQGYVYVQVNNGQWLIDHVQRQIRDIYAPLRAPPKAPVDATRDAGERSGNSTEQSPPERSTPANTLLPPPGTSSVGTPWGAPLNRTQ